MRKSHKGNTQHICLETAFDLKCKSKCIFLLLLNVCISDSLHSTLHLAKNGKAIKHKMVIKINLRNKWKEKERNAPWMSKPQNLSWHAVFNRNVLQTPRAHAAEHIWMLQVYLEWPLQVGGQEWNKEFEFSRPSESYSELSVWLRGRHQIFVLLTQSLTTSALTHKLH